MTRTGVNALTHHWVQVRLTPNPTTYPRVRKIGTRIRGRQVGRRWLWVEGLLQEGDEGGEQGGVAQDLEQ